MPICARGYVCMCGSNILLCCFVLSIYIEEKQFLSMQVVNWLRFYLANVNSNAENSIQKLPSNSLPESPAPKKKAFPFSRASLNIYIIKNKNHNKCV